MAHPNRSQLCDRYNAAYGKVADKMGARTPGRNICRDGWSDRRAATVREKQDGLEHLRAMLAPPASTSQPVSAPVSTGYSVPDYIVACESGGNWSAVNPSSGAGGAYQILPSTWAAYGGTGAPQDASPEEQSRIAAEIYADSGAAAWVCG